MTINTRIPLTNEARTAIKKAIAAHPQADEAYNAFNLTGTASALVGQLWGMMDKLGIDAAPIIATADMAAANPMTAAPVSIPVPTPADMGRALEVATALGIMPPATVASPPFSDLGGIMRELEMFIRPDMAARLKAGIADLQTAATKATIDSEAMREALAIARATPAAPAVIHTAPAASRGTVSTLGAVFGIRGQWAKVPCQTWAPCVDTPAIDPGYIFNPDILGPVMSALDRGDSAWLYGAKGAGKTELARQIAARTGRPFVRIGFGGDMDKYALLGQHRPDGSGAFAWNDGILTQAIRKPGCVILLDEPSIALPGLLSMFQTCMDIRELALEDTGERVAFADGVAVVAADNTDGYGDSTGGYHGTGAMNEAFLDRFPRKVPVSTPPRDVLARIITGRTKAPQAAALMLADLIRNSEALSKAGKLSTHLSLRPVLAFARDVMADLPLAVCLETSVLSSLPASEAQALRTHVLAQLDLTALRAAAHPGAIPATAAPLSAAGQTAVDDFSMA